MKNLNDWYIQNENPSHWSFDNGLLSMQVQEGNIFGAGSSDVDQCALQIQSYNLLNKEASGLFNTRDLTLATQRLILICYMRGSRDFITCTLVNQRL
ncbi:hypothetical protein AB6D10_23370 [Vibrio splendidus]